MQTLSVQIQDDYMQQFMDFVKNSHSNITITKDKNLELDPYFYERQTELQKIRDDMKNGKTKMIDNETFWSDIEKYLETL